MKEIKRDVYLNKIVGLKEFELNQNSNILKH